MSAAHKSPLQVVKERFGSKAELARKLGELLEPREGEETEGLVARLERAANKKLLHLLRVGERVRELGGREALAARVAALRGQAKDRDFVARVRRYTPGRLVDLHDSLVRRARRRGQDIPAGAAATPAAPAAQASPGPAADDERPAKKRTKKQPAAAKKPAKRASAKKKSASGPE
jgi:hypothetical protein